jgi:hypothetical protein
MDKFSVSVDFRTPSSSRSLPLGRRYVNPDAFLDRMDRLNARRQDGRSNAINSAPQHPDAGLLHECEALDSAWRYEVATLLVQKRLNTPEADAIAEAARAATKVPRAPAMRRRRHCWTSGGRPNAPRAFTVTPFNSGCAGVHQSFAWDPRRFSEESPSPHPRQPAPPAVWRASPSRTS